MRAVTIVALAVVMMMIGVALPLPAEPSERTGDDSAGVKLHFKGQSVTTVPPKPGNSTEESAMCPSRLWGGRFLGPLVGKWEFTVSGDVEIAGSFMASLWASSTDGAKNAGFGLNFYVDGSEKDAFYTNRMEVNAPVKLTISDSLSTKANAGSTIGLYLYWFSDPKHFAGPTSTGEFLYGSSVHDSFISITLATAPISINLTTPVVEKDTVRVTAILNESLGMDPQTFIYKLAIAGPATPKPEDLSVPTITSSDNGTSVSWLWSWKKSRATSGMYTLTASASYDGNNTYSVGMQAQITFTQANTNTDLLNSITGGNPLVLPLIIIVIAAAGGGGGFAAHRWRKKKKARLELAD